MAYLVKRCWATGFPLLRRISAGSGNFADGKLSAQMTMSTCVGSSPRSRKTSPWLMLPPVIEDGGDTVYKFYNLSEDKEKSFRRKSEEELADDDAKFVGSSHGWLALFNQRNNNNLFLYNPITRRHIKLPPIGNLPDPKINLTPDGRRGSVYKLILSSSPDDDECIAMMIFGPERRLAFCHPCRSTEWTPIGELYYRLISQNFPILDGVIGIFPRSYVDIVYSSTQKLFFCQTLSTMELECWDLANSLSPRIHSSWKFCRSDYSKKLMGWTEAKRQVNLVYSEEYNQLFIVMRYVMKRMSPDGSYVHPIYYGKYRGWDNSSPYGTIGFDAYKFDFGVEKPQLVKGSLDGLSMFIGINHSIAMPITPQLKKLTPNCIYYTDSNRNSVPPSSLYGGHDIGIFDYTNRTISPCYNFPVDVESIKRIMPAPMWFTPSHR
ncbi:hypothetical protein CASFOL_014764 [Castilleja foliolosa]|uniref:KIB1-4 beta-propeller domain-containing protein n=1 Tax=Castilleja foliolosa TaxID=1961234 RepID=A0ABD3DDW6_9LAMI